MIGGASGIAGHRDANAGLTHLPRGTWGGTHSKALILLAYLAWLTGDGHAPGQATVALELARLDRLDPRNALLQAQSDARVRTATNPWIHAYFSGWAGTAALPGITSAGLNVIALTAFFAIVASGGQIDWARIWPTSVQRS